MSSAHTSLRSTSARPDKGYKGLGMEGAVARWYAKNTGRNLAPFRDAAQRLHARLPRGAQVLESAPGPGYLAIELAKLGNCQVTGLDISRSFVEIATHNATEAGVPVQFRQGDAAAMPLGDGLFDMVVCRAAFKNFSRPVEALNEMYR